MKHIFVNLSCLFILSLIYSVPFADVVEKSKIEVTFGESGTLHQTTTSSYKGILKIEEKHCNFKI